VSRLQRGWGTLNQSPASPGPRLLHALGNGVGPSTDPLAEPTYSAVSRSIGPPLEQLAASCGEISAVVERADVLYKHAEDLR
jgi:hypothetical protein